ncbi:hypothetical protein [Planomonospora parontospora]|uniref:hypothetical protein n=1 Tax=Planomonospora parontospora TaxID=58119 RepID=UPI001670D1EC|nr:hypothetical protein [Planomonospora parontospora]GGL42355.1 hypothetical protein GCM10014719_49580 [Planomonospora parontospora subsp. antibiotica]GII18403.1 hypothetical protein Ppa05_51290 [Planomonospora parontospora subsp. antibiotica]
MAGEPAGLVLSPEEHVRLCDALGHAGLDSEAEWDSLDVACALTVLEDGLGIVLDPSAAHPRRLRSREALVDAIAGHGTRRRPGARLSIDLPEHLSGSGSVGERERRRLEYRLSLAHRDLRLAVSRRGPLRIVAIADDPLDLPLDPASLSALPIGAREPAEPSPAPALSVPAFHGAESGPVIETVESEVREFVLERGGRSWPHANPMIAVGELRELGYLDAHPEQLVRLDGETALLPAACLNSFEHLWQAGGSVLVTFTATVFRRETRYMPELGRLPAFTCREILWGGDAAYSDAVAEAVGAFLTRLADRFGLRHRWVRAEDPFFLADGTGGGKHELRVRTPGGEIAVASVNRHGDHFAVRKSLPPEWTTGCAGLGLERWALAATGGGGR